MKLGPNVNLEASPATPMFSGAGTAAIMNGRIIATLQDKDFIEHGDLERPATRSATVARKEPRHRGERAYRDRLPRSQPRRPERCSPTPTRS